MEPYNLEVLFDSFRAITPDIALFLPRNSDLRQLSSCENGDKKTPVIHYCIDGASKVRERYIGCVSQLLISLLGSLCIFW